MRLSGVAAALILAIAVVGCNVDPSTALFNSGGDSYFEAALGTTEVTKFGARGNRTASYDTLGNAPRRLRISGHQLLEDSTCTLALWIDEPQEGRTYVIGPREGEAHAIFTSSTFPEDLLRSYSSSQANAGTLVLSRFDTKRRIAEGTFEFVARNNVEFTKDPATPDSIQVMNGRFRLGYDVVGPYVASESD